MVPSWDSKGVGGSNGSSDDGGVQAKERTETAALWIAQVEAVKKSRQHRQQECCQLSAKVIYFAKTLNPCPSPSR
jgi:hypothetical protein